MASTKDDDARGPIRTDKCSSCGSRFAGDQRYCLECGARRGPLPAAIAAQIAALLARGRGAKPAGAAPGAAGAAEQAPKPEPTPSPLASWMPSPRAAALAVLGMLALGVMLGSVTGQVARSAGIGTILLESEAATPPPEEAEEEAPVTASAEPEPVEEATQSVVEEEVVAPEPEAEPEPEGEEGPEMVPFNPEEEATEELPPVKHVFLIVLGENGFEETFGATSPAPYLSKTLPEQGELLSNYYSVTHGDLANEIALLSGQGPTVETAANCPNYGDIVPGTESATGQVEGAGCVYPATTETLVSELVAKKLKWKAYVEDMEKGAVRGQATSCRHPELGTPDLDQVPVPGDTYQTWRDPFVYFHSIVDGSECAGRDVGLEALSTDLATAKKTPAFSYIAPSACYAGGTVPCEEGRVTGALAIEEFLKKVIPEITASPAYKEEGGLIAITSTQAQQTGEHTDTSACCAYPEYPNVPPVEAVEGTVPGTHTTGGGGRVGMLILSPFVKAGTVNETNYNHFSFLDTVEELFELEALGYTSEGLLLPFNSEVFNYAEEGESTSEASSTVGK